MKTDRKAGETEGQERVAEQALSKMPNIWCTWKEVGAGRKSLSPYPGQLPGPGRFMSRGLESPPRACLGGGALPWLRGVGVSESCDEVPHLVLRAVEGQGNGCLLYAMEALRSV